MQIISSIGGCLSEITGSHGLIVGMFLAGLVGGTTHCVTMCGPFVLSQTGNLSRLSETALLPYHLGRMTTYLFLTLLTYSVFSLVFVYSDLKAYLAVLMLMTAAVLFLVSAFPRLSVFFPWATKLNSGFLFDLISKFMPKSEGRNSLKSQYMMGILLGFMPCGMIVAALLAISSIAESLAYALLAMALFSLGTVPALIAVAIGGRTLHQKFPTLSKKMSKVIKCASAMWLFLLSITMII